MDPAQGRSQQGQKTNANLGRAVSELLGDLAPVVSAGIVTLIERIVEFARDPERLRQLQAGLDAIAGLIEDELERYERDPRSFLYDEMLAGPAVLLIAKVRTDDDSVLLDALEFALSENDLTREMHTAVVDSPMLSDVQRQRLLHGFEKLKEQSWVLACDSLLTGAEGMIWDAALERGVIDAQRRLTEPSKRQRVIKSVNGLVSDGAIEGLRPSYRHFLNRQLFAAAGNDLRHGRSGRDPRAGALFAAPAVFGWLDHHDKTNLIPQLARNLDQFVEQLAESLETEQFASDEPIDLALASEVS